MVNFINIVFLIENEIKDDGVGATFTLKNAFKINTQTSNKLYVHF